jgi:uncharacterized protein Yka (UPF0111/DUF47 family)
MSFRLFPKAPKFFEFFREPNRIIVEAATVLNTIAFDFVDCDVRCQMINRLEADGDALNRRIIQSRHGWSPLPFRGSLLKIFHPLHEPF